MTSDLSPRGRARNLDRLASETFDVLVIGGGIVGAGIARDAAMRGLTVALLEKGDFASGTSGKTSRLVHGGLRYLKNFRIGLVRQAVRERDRLLRRAPTLVRPLSFTIPAFQGKGTGPVGLRFGLFVYDFLSKDKVLPRREWLDPRRTRAGEPALRAEGLRGAGRYHDALTNDARLVLAIVRAAADAGALVANHVEVLEVLREGGRVSGARARDLLGPRDLSLQARIVVNATGVWLNRLRAPGAETPLRPTKGVHLLVPRDRVGNREAVVLSAKRDGRMLFVLPWGPLTLIGTTDTDHSGSTEDVVPEADDVAYLLESANDAFPEAKLTPEDVVSAYAGLRPLLGGGSSGTKESDISREHEIFEDPDGLLSVAGGKLTTQRAMAEEVVDRVFRRLGRTAPCATVGAALGPPAGGEEAFRSMGFDGASAAHLASRVPLEAVRPWIGEPDARESLVGELPYRWVEVDVAVEGEMAMTLQDVLVRRLGIFYEARDQGLDIAPEVAARIGRRLGWDPDRLRAEIHAYEELLHAHRRFREGHAR